MMRILCATLCVGLLAACAEGQSFVNWETPHVHPLDIVPGGAHLLAVNTADNRLEVFEITAGGLVSAGSVPVGLDPVSVRARTDTEVWVVNHISDSVSIVDLTTMNVVATLRTRDEPADVVFAGSPQRAFVSCSQANVVLVFDPTNLTAAPLLVPIDGEDPRAMAVSADGSQVYVAVFESGNATTVLGGGSLMGGGYPPNAVSDPTGPYGGTNPPPNDGAVFRPPMKPGNPAPPAVGLIVQKNANGRWMDDNAVNWTSMVSGLRANTSGRVIGWNLPDHDVAVIEANTLTIDYASGAMNICMALAVHPTTGEVTVVGTDATNRTRFEPVLGGRFIRVNLALIDPTGPTTTTVADLNDHLVYTTAIPFVPIPQADRDKSIGDPRGIVWKPDGTRGYVTGMGSNNVVVIDSSGGRLSPLTPTVTDSIQVGEGPTGIVLDDGRDRLYVLNKFAGSISIIDLNTETVTATRPLFDPTPAAIRVGRKHLYDTHKTSGLGHLACASCHVDTRMDRLSWDLGNPSGDVKAMNQNCPSGNCPDWHPMKGPMTTQTFLDIIGKEPHHWRGDREGIEAFNPAFVGLLGDDVPLNAAEMQEFEDFLASLHYPPNPFRNFNNTLPVDLPLLGHFTTGRFAAAGSPLPNGDAVAGLDNFRVGLLDGVNCVTCHTLPTGGGPDGTFQGPFFVPAPIGPNGEHHLALVAVDGSTNVSIKIPQLRNLYDKVGFEATQRSNRAGAGFLHDGSVDSIARFVSEPVFNLANVQEVADMVAFMLAFSGSDLPEGSDMNPLEAPGVPSQDTHAAVGRQTTLDGPSAPPQTELIADMISLADAGAVGLIVRGRTEGLQRGFSYLGSDTFQSDRLAEVLTQAELEALAGPDAELTYTVVPAGMQTRTGIDRDQDGFFDRDEIDVCSDPANAAITPDNVTKGDITGDGLVTLIDYHDFAICLGGPGANRPGSCLCPFDFDLDNDLDLIDQAEFLNAFDGP